MAAPGSKECNAFLLCTAALDAVQACVARVVTICKRGPRHPAATRAAPPPPAAPAPPGQAAAAEAAGVYPLQFAMAAMAMAIGPPPAGAAAGVPTEDLLCSGELADARELVRRRAAYVAACAAYGTHDEDAQARAPLEPSRSECPARAAGQGLRCADARAVAACPRLQ